MVQPIVSHLFFKLSALSISFHVGSTWSPRNKRRTWITWRPCKCFFHLVTDEWFCVLKQKWCKWTSRPSVTLIFVFQEYLKSSTRSNKGWGICEQVFIDFNISKVPKWLLGQHKAVSHLSQQLLDLYDIYDKFLWDNWFNFEGHVGPLHEVWGEEIPHKVDSCRLFNSDFIKINK